MDPFWEKGMVVTDLSECKLSRVKITIYAMIGVMPMSFFTVGVWSRQVTAALSRRI